MTTLPGNPAVRIGAPNVMVMHHAACCDRHVRSVEHDNWCRTLDRSAYPIGGPRQPLTSRVGAS